VDEYFGRGFAGEASHGIVEVIQLPLNAARGAFDFLDDLLLFCYVRENLFEACVKRGRCLRRSCHDGGEEGVLFGSTNSLPHAGNQFGRSEISRVRKGIMGLVGFSSYRGQKDMKRKL
jgi:hypothetical protein